MASRTNTRKKKSEQTEAQSILNNVQNLDINQVVNDVSKLQLSVQNTLAALSAELSNKLQQMEKVDAAIGLKEERLKELFDIEKEQMIIEEVKSTREYEEKENERLNKERNQEWDFQNQERAKAWLREKEEYDYRRKIERQQAEDDFNNKIFITKRNEEIRKANFEKDWADRENIIASRENEFIILQNKVAEFDTLLEEAKIATKEKVSADLGREYGYKINFIKKEAEGEVKLKDQEIKSQYNTILSLNNQIESLENQLRETRDDAKEVATQALQSASGRQVVEALQKANYERETTNSRNK